MDAETSQSSTSWLFEFLGREVAQLAKFIGLVDVFYHWSALSRLQRAHWHLNDYVCCKRAGGL